MTYGPARRCLAVLGWARVVTGPELVEFCCGLDAHLLEFFFF
jgi:hypothetical protein